MLAVFEGPTVGTLYSGDVPNIGSADDTLHNTYQLDGRTDWNQDGYADLAADDDRMLRIYFGPILEDRAVGDWDANLGGSGNWNSDQPGIPEACGDFNGDGWPDVSMTALNVTYAALLYGPFVGQFPDWLGSDVVLTSPDGEIDYLVPVGDFDGDGSDDLLVSIATSSGMVHDLLFGQVGFGY